MQHAARMLFTSCLGLALGLSFAPEGRAAGLGELVLKSALGQPLSAEIEILGLLPKEFEATQARIASPEAYKEARLNYPSLVRLLRLEPQKRQDGTTWLMVTSHRPINEPSLDILVEFTWPKGRLIQKYSVLLDPAR